MDTKQLLFDLCAPAGPAGREGDAAEKAAELLSQFAAVRRDALGNVIGHLGAQDAPRHVLLDAHMDEIGLVVTSVAGGFVKVGKAGGVDLRTLPAHEVVIWGVEPIPGLFCATPPHLSKESDRSKFSPLDEMMVDTGLPADQLKDLVKPGDRVTLKRHPASLLNNRITSGALDDRAGVASLLKCLCLLPELQNTQVTVLFSVQEEVGQAGAITGSFGVDATEAIAVDVSFAMSPGCPQNKCGKLGDGVMIGYSPLLSRPMFERFLSLAKEENIPYQTEIMGGDTGTNADYMAVSRTGIPCGLLSIPQRYMHTACEVVDVDDVEAVAKLLAAYLVKGDEKA